MFHALMKGGWMMLPLAVCSLVSVTDHHRKVSLLPPHQAEHRAEEVLALVRKQRPMRRSPSPMRQRCRS